jgi:hypothetical protein
MPLAETNRVQVRYAQESTWGETPSTPATTEVRITSESLTHNKETIVSEEIRSDRQRIALLEVSVSAEGDFGYELAYSAFETFFANGLRNSISSATVSLASCTVGASSITGPTGTDFVANFAAGQFVILKSSGNSSHNGVVAQIDSLTSTVLTTVGTTLTASVLTSAAVTGRTLTNGTTKNSYFVEVDFDDITAVKYFTGMRIGSFSLSAAAQQIVTGVFSWMGEQGFTASTTVASSVVTSANQTTAITGAANVLNVFENSGDVGVAVQAFEVNVNNNMRARPQIGQKGSAEHGDGGVDVTGNLNVYFENISLYEKFINHTESNLALKMKDADGNYIIVSMPSVYYSSGAPAGTGQDQDVFLSMDYTAIKDSTKGYTIRMDFLPAV